MDNRETTDCPQSVCSGQSSVTSSSTSISCLPLVSSHSIADPWDEVHAVQIPDHAHPGKDFLVHFLQSWVLKLKCPPDGAAGKTLLFLPPKTSLRDKSSGQKIIHYHIRDEFKATLPQSTINKIVQARFYNSPDVQSFRSTRSCPSSPLCGHTHHPDRGCGTHSLFSITVPSQVPSDSFLKVVIMGQLLRVHCPPTKKPGERIFLEIPNPWEVSKTQPSTRADPSEEESSSSLDLVYREFSESKFAHGILDPKQDSCHALEDTPSHLGNNTCSVSETPSSSPVAELSNESDSTQVEQSRVPCNEPIVNSDSSYGNTERSESNPDSFSESNHVFDALIPNEINPGDSFPFIVAGNIQLLITCPPNARPGERVRFHLPISGLLGSSDRLSKDIDSFYHSSTLDEINVVYKGKRWMRPLRISDMKFIWIPMDHDDCAVTSVHRFDIGRSAFVRKLTFTEDIKYTTLCDVISFIPASEAAMCSNVCLRDVSNSDNAGYREIFSARDIAIAANMNFNDKVTWFRRACGILRVGFFHGHVKIQIRRYHLLRDSINAVMSLDRNDLRKVWRFSFIDEGAIDAGGLSREWYDLVTKTMFDPCFGLWTCTALHQNKVQINPCSGECSTNHLLYFRFLGRVMGKALFDNHVVTTHMVQCMYKSILAWPLTFSDLQCIDEEYYRHLKYLTTLNAGELEDLSLDFTIVDENLTVKSVVELMPNGQKQSLTSENLPEYLKACWMHKMFGRCKSQLGSFLLGFFDVIPEPLVTVFDFQELELVMCGIPVIDTDDWCANTIYTGLCEDEGPNHIISIWFWELVQQMDQEMRARLLQFVTGSSGVPIGGFSLLQGNDGNIRCFTIHGIDEDSSYYPRSHTCFNRIDLPAYATKSTLKERLYTAILFSKGFDMD